MTNATSKISSRVQAHVEEQGLQRAADLFPDVVAAAAAKALAPLATPPIPPLTIPALTLRLADRAKGAT